MDSSEIGYAGQVSGSAEVPDEVMRLAEALSQVEAARRVCVHFFVDSTT